MRGGAGDQSYATLVGEELIRPLHEDRDAIAKAGQIQNVDEQPREPRDVALQLERSDGGDGAMPADPVAAAPAAAPAPAAIASATSTQDSPRPHD